MLAATETFGRSLSALLLQFVRLGVSDDFGVVVLVIEGQFLVRVYVFLGEKGEFVDVLVGMVVRNCVDGAIWLTRMVDEACWPTHMHTIDGVFGFAVERMAPHLLPFVVLVDLVLAAFDEIAMPLLLV